MLADKIEEKGETSPFLYVLKSSCNPWFVPQVLERYSCQGFFQSKSGSTLALSALWLRLVTTITGRRFPCNSLALADGNEEWEIGGKTQSTAICVRMGKSDKDFPLLATLKAHSESSCRGLSFRAFQAWGDFYSRHNKHTVWFQIPSQILTTVSELFNGKFSLPKWWSLWEAWEKCVLTLGF